MLFKSYVGKKLGCGRQWTFFSNVKGKKKRINTQIYIEVEEEDLHSLKINFNVKRTVGKANKEINVEKIIIDLKVKN